MISNLKNTMIIDEKDEVLAYSHVSHNDSSSHMNWQFIHLLYGKPGTILPPFELILIITLTKCEPLG